MKFGWQKSRNIRRCVTESALFAAALFCLLFLYRGMYPFGDGSILTTDLYSQYMPLLYRFYDVVTGQKNLFMELAVSGGANLYADTVNEIINPFNYVLLLFGRERLYLGVNVLLLLYGAGAAASCRYFLEKLSGREEKPFCRGSLALALSLCYAFSGYTAYNYQIIRWMYFPVLFPLFVLALLRLLREKKGGMYGILLAYQLMLSVQLGFMTLLFTLFAGGIYVLAAKDGKSGRLACLAKWTCIGLLLSSVVLVPALAGLFSSARSGETLGYLGVMKRHGLDDVFERVFQIGQPVMLGLGIYTVWKRISCRIKKCAPWRASAPGACEKSPLPGGCIRRGKLFLGRLFQGEQGFWLAMTAFLWGTALLQPANLLWHLGSYVCFPVRYGYMALLCMAALLDGAAGRETEAAGVRLCGASGCARALWSACGVLCLMCAAAVVFIWEDRIVQAFSSLAISSVCPAETAAVILVCALLGAGTACMCAAQNARRAARNMRGTDQNAQRTADVPGACGGLTLCAAVCGFLLYAMILLPQDYGVRQENERAYAEMTEEAAAYERAVEKEGADAREQWLLARQKDEESLPINAALVSRKGSLSGYFPTEDKRTKAAMEGLGYLAPWVSVRSVGGTLVSDELLRRVIVFDGENLCRNPLQSPESVLALQERMTALTAGRSLLERFSGTELVREDGSLYLMVEEESSLYLDAGQTADSLQVFVNGQELDIPEKMQAASPHRLIGLGTFAGEGVEIAVLSGGMAVAPEQMELGVLDTAMWQEALLLLDQAEGQAGMQKSAPKGAEEIGNTFGGARTLPGKCVEISERKGTIRIAADGKAGDMLFVPFMALDGWRCVQNGSPVDIVPLFGGFMGIKLLDGENEIVFSFIPPGLYTGLWMTAAGAAAVLWMVLRKGCGQSAFCRKTDRALGGLYRLMFAGGILGIYVIPALGMIVYLAGKVLGK